MNEFTTKDYWINHTSTIPANYDERISLFVRWHKPKLSSPHHRRRPVVMVHGRSISGLVAFDLEFHSDKPGPAGAYSWARELARDGYDVFVMDLQGMGKSTRPPQMKIKCNINPAQQLIVLPEKCPAEYSSQLSNSQSDWDELDCVIKWITQELPSMENVPMPDKVDLIGYSAGAYAVGPYAMQHPEKVSSLFLLAPVFACQGPSTPPPLPLSTPAGVWGFPMHITDKEGFKAGWDNEVYLDPRCPDQRDDGSGIVDEVWNAVLNNDDVGRTWGPGVVRFRNAFWWGWNPQVVSTDETNLGRNVPVIIVYGEKDHTANNKALNFSVPDLYKCINGQHKLMYRVDATGHHMPWERQRKQLHTLSKQWLKKYKVDDKTSGAYRVDWEGDYHPMSSSTYSQTQEQGLAAMSVDGGEPIQVAIAVA